MTSDSNSKLRQLINDLAVMLGQEKIPGPEHYKNFLADSDFGLHLLDEINALPESAMDETPALYSACIFLLDVMLAQLQVEIEQGNAVARKPLSQLMSNLAQTIVSGTHTLGFWLPVLNAFYEAHIEVSPELKDAYFNLVHDESSPEFADDTANINAIQNLIDELADLSIFDIAEYFFSQSYALPPDLYADLVIDLFNIEKGPDIAILSLLHPEPEVREAVLETFDEMMAEVTLSSQSLSRLQSIKTWYPDLYQPRFESWIKIQRKKGVVFQKAAPLTDVSPRIKASEIDGSGAQGLFIEFKAHRTIRLGSLLFKQQVGIKDIWMTPPVSVSEAKRYYSEAFKESVMLKSVDVPYLCAMVNHFLTLTIAKGNVPDLHLLEIQELLGVRFMPQRLDTDVVIEALAVKITPFTPERVQTALKRSKSWCKSKRYTESWFVENAHIDKLVNRTCSIVEGIKVCQFDEAMDQVFAEEMELKRWQWVFHFLWVALWLKASAKPHETAWQDSFFIAYAIHQGTPLADIPIMQEICYQSVVNSMETMHERRTHLT